MQQNFIKKINIYENISMITREQLLTVDVEKLADILLTLYANNKDMHKQMDLLFAALHEDDTQLVATIKKELSSLKRSKSYVDYYESGGLAGRIDELRLSIVRDLQKKSPEKAMDMMIKLLDESKHTLERSDDSNGEIQSVFIQATQDCGSIAKFVSRPIEDFVDIVFVLFMNNEYVVSQEIILAFKDALQEQGLLLLQKRFESSLHNHEYYRLRNGLQQIADCLQDVDAYIRACLSTGPLRTHDCIEIARRFVQHNRPQEALNYTEIAMNDLDLSHSWYDDVLAIKIDALELKGDFKIAQEELIAWFMRKLDGKIYDQILQHMKSELYEDFIKAALQQAFTCNSIFTAINFLMHMKNLQELSNFIFIRLDDIKGDGYYTLRPAADALRNDYPLAAILLYRKMMQSILEQAKSKYYDYAAKDLIDCALLSSHIVDWQSYDNHEIYFQHIEEKHKRKPRFWETYKSALQKQAAKEAKLLARTK